MSSIVFIDSRVQDYERLIAGLGTDIQVVILDPALDGIAQIAAALTGVTDLDSIHIVSHGSSGTLYLGSTVVTEDNLEDYGTELAQIGEALSEDGDLLLYGCDVAAGESGANFIERLAFYTGSDVAASTDLTGSAALGGDWQLEASAGLVETASLFTAGTDYDALFAAPIVTAAGRLDPTFSSDGKVSTTIGTGSDIAYGVAVQSDGKVVVAGYSTGTTSDFALVRYTTSGSLDASFSGDGRLTTAIGTGADVGYGVAIQSDGKIVVAGYSSGATSDFALARYTTSGALDGTFSGNGLLTTTIGTGADVSTSIALHSNGRIVVAGYSINSSGNYDFALVRYTTSGALDTTFDFSIFPEIGKNDGKVTTTVGAGNDYGQSVAIQSNDKIVVAGYADMDSTAATNYDFALVRYNASGSRDTTFSGDGRVTTAIGTGADYGQDIAIQADGKIVVAGYSHNGSNYDFALARYTTHGVLDTTFSGDGIVTTAIGTGNDYGQSVVIQSDGKIVVAGYSVNSSGNYDFAIARYTSSGSLDLSFDPAVKSQIGDGKLVVGIGTGNDYGTAAAVAPNGVIVVAGYSWSGTTNDFAVVRVMPGGILNQTLTEEVPYSYTFPSSTFSDPDLTTLTYTATQTDGSALPPWLTFNPSTRTFSGTPNDPYVGIVDIRVTATDTSLASVSDTFRIAVPNINDAPVVVNAITDRAADVLTEFLFLVPVTTFSDEDDDTLTYAAAQSNGSVLPSWLTFDAGTLTFGTAGGEVPIGELGASYTIRLTATDPQGIAANETFVLDVTEGNINIITGDAGANSLPGSAGDDIIDGGAGADTMPGNLGDDVYYVDDAGDVVTETSLSDTDLVKASVTYTLPANVEILVLTGGTAINGTGNLLNNQLSGNGGANSLDGGAGIDTLTGGAGNDTYVVDNTNDLIVEGLNAGDDLVQASANYVLAGNVERLTLTGSGSLAATGNTLGNTLTGNPGNNSLVGGDGSDSLVGLAGNDTLDGGAGVDTMLGGTGNDTYVVDNALDVVTEDPNAGTDLVQSSVTLTLATDAENLTLTGGADISGTGNGVANQLTGNDGNNVLAGGSGDDVLDGGAGNDTLRGEAGNDTLQGGTGTDSMEGGTGNDVFYVDSASDIVVENVASGSADQVVIGINFTTEPQVFQLYDNIERVSVVDVNAGIAVAGNDLDNLFEGSDADDSLDGAAGEDTLEGAAGNDTLEGGSGVDSMLGGAGGDLYYVDNSGDQVIETGNAAGLTQGPAGLESIIDTVIAAINYSLSSVAYVENVTLSATATTATGNTLNNVLTGNARANTLNGLAGLDTMIGGAGNDTYVLDRAGDRVTETAAAGTDQIQTTVTLATLAANVENLRLMGTGNLNATGNGLANTLYANSGSNVLNGGAGIDTVSYQFGATAGVTVNLALAGSQSTGGSGLDTLSSFARLTGSNYADRLTGSAAGNTLTGLGRNDTLNGRLGNDTLAGGAGKDTLTGGGGADKFDFNAALSATTNVDRITDFSVTSDTIRLDNDIFTAIAAGNLAAGAFYKGAGITAAHDSTDRILYNTTTGNLYYDADGQGGAAAKLFATLTTHPATLTAADFFIVT